MSAPSIPARVPHPSSAPPAVPAAPPPAPPAPATPLGDPYLLRSRRNRVLNHAPFLQYSRGSNYLRHSHYQYRCHQRSCHRNTTSLLVPRTRIGRLDYMIVFLSNNGHVQRYPI